MRFEIWSVSAAACFLTVVSLPAQFVGTGKFIVTTLNATTPAAATSTIQFIDPYTKTTTPIKFAKTFPPSPTSEGPDSILVETPITMLVGTRVINGTGNVYRITYGNGWNYSLLNTGSTNVPSVGGLAVIGKTIYMAGANIIGSTGNSALCMSMPSNGGNPQIYVDLVKAGATGLGNALCSVGTDLHYFTFESTTSTTSQSEHWKIDTTATTPTAVKVANLPLSKRLTTSNFGVVQAIYDPNTKLIVIAGVYGDVLWRDLSGKDVRHVATGGTTTNQIDALAINTDTGTVGIGDRTGNYEELRCDGNTWKDTYITLPSPITTTTRLSNLAYVPASPNNLAFASGCNQSTGTAACNYSNILPAKGSTTFTFTLEGPTKRALLVLGARKSTLDMTGMGAPGCVLQVSMDVLVPGTITTTGAAVGPVPIPSTVPNVSVFTQWLLTDSVNSMGVVVTDARQLDVR